ncbi:MAG: cell wall-binding protein [Paenibacillaceae bacterium]|nr:cell wall-binding protein [Paenibacillaceae bacterium]
MRKQTKLVAVLSTAALLALGASMSSFAATGWQEENGTWVYYDKSGDKETEKWEKSGDNWFYLNDNGEMATDLIVEYKDNYYYVDENGSMVTNKWVSVENDNYDGDSDNEPVNNWYYFGANGRAYKSATNNSSPSFKTINGKKYIFNDEGKMLYGWIDENGQRLTDDNAWRAGNGVYYCGGENDGAQTVGWASLNIKDDQWETKDNDLAKGVSSQDTFDDEEQDRWFYFKSNGKKMYDKKGETINGKKYSFDIDGRMNADWVNWEATQTTATNASGTRTATQTQGNATYTEGFRYYGSPEDGARKTKGWFQVVPGSYLNEGDYNDDSENWYYADKDGKLVAGQIKTINSKRYAFDNNGAMIDGYKFILLDADNRTIAATAKKDDKDHPYDTTDNFKANASYWENQNYKFYYFGSSSEGFIKTNKQTIALDGENNSFLLNKSGTYKGAGKTGIDNKKFYQSGMLLTADKDDKYAVIKAVYNADGTLYSASVLTTDDFLKTVGAVNDVKNTKYSEEYDLSTKAADTNATATVKGVEYRLVNTSGTVQKSKNKAKDGNDRCYNVNGSGLITKVFVEN